MRTAAGIRWYLEYLGELSQPEAVADEPGLETGAPVPADPPEREPGQPLGPTAGKRPWRLTLIGQLRLKHLSYRTEQTYLEWASRFARFLNGKDPMKASDDDAVEFLRACYLNPKTSCIS
ncbi:MAG: phage integrase N-terminal SAM-like domain-containing protein [Verrucomicrobia bacterium]|nr:phage integrase N-terminal SAM-like domain-containing protein [Verrucomicrobiota bacterium]